jgi:hypothetical protein
MTGHHPNAAGPTTLELADDDSTYQIIAGRVAEVEDAIRDAAGADASDQCWKLQEASGGIGEHKAGFRLRLLRFCLG